MRRIILYGILMAAVLWVPLDSTDVAELRPVQTVALYPIENGFRVETDTDDFGEGETVGQAVADLVETAPGVIYLDTADYFLVANGAQAIAEDMRSYLKSSVAVCAVEGRGDLKKVSKFLSIQRGLPLLRKWNQETKMPILDCRNDRIKFM